jgi:Flp pilus assembly protein TadB
VVIALLIAMMIATGVPWWVIGVGVVAARQPLVAAAMITAWAVAVSGRRVMRRRLRPSLEAEYFRALAAELRSGASLRMSIGDAAARVPSLDLSGAQRRAVVGAPFEDVAAAVAASLPANGRVAAPALRLAGSTGGRAAAIFEVLADRAAHQAELSRERAVLTAQARLSALVVGVAPLGFAMLLLLTGRAGVLIDHGVVGFTILAAGVGLEVAGIAIVATMLARSR